MAENKKINKGILGSWKQKENDSYPGIKAELQLKCVHVTWHFLMLKSAILK